MDIEKALEMINTEISRTTDIVNAGRRQIGRLKKLESKISLATNKPHLFRVSKKRPTIASDGPV